MFSKCLKLKCIIKKEKEKQQLVMKGSSLSKC